MKIELKNIKHSEFASFETHCYQATLYIDGKRTATVANDGHGGCDLCEPISIKGGSILDRDPEAIARLRAADEYLKKHGNHSTYGDGEILHENMEMRCCTLVNEWLAMKEVKKILKRVSYLKMNDDGKLGLYQLQGKIKPTEENLAKVKQCEWWDDGAYELISGLQPEAAAAKLTEAGIL